MFARLNYCFTHVNNKLDVNEIANKYPLLYTSLLLLLAIAGFAYLLLFPGLVILGLLQLSTLAADTLFSDTYMLSLFWYALVVFGIGVSYHIFTITFSTPKGFVLEQNKTTFKLFNGIKPKSRGYLYPHINKIILSDNCEFEMVKLPVIGVPFWTKNLLVVGFGFLQSLPANYFNSAVTTKLLRYSKRKHPLTNWLAQMADIWVQYPQTFKQRNRLGDKFVYWFFVYYALIYRYAATPVIHKVQLQADTMALEYINDMDLVEAIEAQMVLGQYFSQTYWPALERLIHQGLVPPNDIRPYSTLTAALQKALSNEKIAAKLKALYDKSKNNDGGPKLKLRMENLGHTRVRVPALDGINAAEYFFENNYQEVMHLMDAYWVHNIAERKQSLFNHQIKSTSRTKTNLTFAPG